MVIKSNPDVKLKHDVAAQTATSTAGPAVLDSRSGYPSLAPKLKYPTALLTACSALDNLINPQLKEEIADDASLEPSATV